MKKTILTGIAFGLFVTVFMISQLKLNIANPEHLPVIALISWSSFAIGMCLVLLASSVIKKGNKNEK